MSAFDKYRAAKSCAEYLSDDMAHVLTSIGGNAARLYMPERVAEIIDETVPGTKEEKEALIIAAFYQLAPKKLFEAADSGISFNAAATTILQEIADQARRRLAGEAVEKTAATARIDAALGIAMVERVLKSGAASSQMKAAAYADFETKLRADADAIMPKLDAPKLCALYNGTQGFFLKIMKPPEPENRSKNKPKPAPAAP